MVKKPISRRKVLRNSAVISGGLVVGGTVTTGSVSASQGRGQGGVGYISKSSYDKLTGATNVDCVEDEDGWGDTFYIQREAVGDDSEEGVLIDAPPSCNSNGPDQTFRGYLITAESDTRCSGGPSGDGPQNDDCCSWIFVNRSRNIRFNIEQRITHVHSPIPCHESVEVSVYDDGDGGFSDAFDVVRITFAPVPDGGGGKNGNGNSIEL
jgi:hypothetical protein